MTAMARAGTRQSAAAFATYLSNAAQSGFVCATTGIGAANRSAAVNHRRALTWRSLWMKIVESIRRGAMHRGAGVETVVLMMRVVRVHGNAGADCSLERTIPVGEFLVSHASGKQDGFGFASDSWLTDRYTNCKKD